MGAEEATAVPEMTREIPSDCMVRVNVPAFVPTSVIKLSVFVPGSVRFDVIVAIVFALIDPAFNAANRPPGPVKDVYVCPVPTLTALGIEVRTCLNVLDEAKLLEELTLMFLKLSLGFPWDDA